MIVLNANSLYFLILCSFKLGLMIFFRNVFDKYSQRIEAVISVKILKSSVTFITTSKSLKIIKNLFRKYNQPNIMMIQLLKMWAIATLHLFCVFFSHLLSSFPLLSCGKNVVNLITIYSHHNWSFEEYFFCGSKYKSNTSLLQVLLNIYKSYIYIL